MRLIYKYFYYILLLQMLVVGYIKTQSTCSMPDQTTGECVHYRRCSNITKQLKSSLQLNQSLPQSFTDYVRQSRCNIKSTEIFICCETRNIEPLTNSTTIKSNTNRDLNEQRLNILNADLCGADRNKLVIGFGTEANLAEYPWMALLQYNSTEKYQCGGSLITNRYVLTAAHCIVGQAYEVIGVRLGEHTLDASVDCEKIGRHLDCAPPEEDFGIETKLPHPQFKDINNDIALLRLDRYVVFKIHIQPICLPITEQSGPLEKLHNFIISGWGTTEKGAASNVLLKALIPHKPIDFCQTLFKTYTLNDNHLCAGGELRRDSCKGDSGGPLFSTALVKPNTPRYVQFGVVSFGVRTCGAEENYPSIYTKVAAFLPWIIENIVP